MLYIWLGLALAGRGKELDGEDIKGLRVASGTEVRVCPGHSTTVVVRARHKRRSRVYSTNPKADGRALGWDTFEVDTSGGSFERGTFTMAADPRKTWDKPATLTLRVKGRPDLKQEITFIPRYDCDAILHLGGADGAGGNAGNDGDRGGDSRAGVAGEGEAGGQGGDGQNGQGAAEATVKVAWSGRAGILQACDAGMDRCVAVNTEKAVLHIDNSGGDGGPGGPGGQGGPGGNSEEGGGGRGGRGGEGGRGGDGGDGAALTVVLDKDAAAWKASVVATNSGGAAGEGGSGGFAGSGGSGSVGSGPGGDTGEAGKPGREGRPGPAPTIEEQALEPLF